MFLLCFVITQLQYDWYYLECRIKNKILDFFLIEFLQKENVSKNILVLQLIIVLFFICFLIFYILIFYIYFYIIFNIFPPIFQF